MNISRRQLITFLSVAYLSQKIPLALGGSNFESLPDSASRFRYIYGDSTRRNDFFNFLKNVFNLYPEAEFHAAIRTTSEKLHNDRDIYLSLAQQLPNIKPFFADLSYALPALNKQKELIASQTMSLLGKPATISGYLEFGSDGRYVDSIEERTKITGERYFVHSVNPTYSPLDIIDRGQIPFAGEHIALNNYATKLNSHIPSNSVELVTVYIGFHHCPLSLRDEFISSIRLAMKPGGYLVVRDHNVVDKHMDNLVSLAHDVFNLGTNESWQYNENEFRAFYSLSTLRKMLTRNGFSGGSSLLYQNGDPTHNALMVFRKA